MLSSTTLQVVGAIYILLNRKALSDELPKTEKKNSTAFLSNIVNEFSTDSVNGGYIFRYIASNGIFREEIADFDNDGNLVVDGVYSDALHDGKVKYIAYHADKNGYNTYDVDLDDKENSRSINNPFLVASILG